MVPNPTKDGGQSIHDQTIAEFPVRHWAMAVDGKRVRARRTTKSSEWFLGTGAQAGQGSSTLAAGESITMNNVFRVGGAQDLMFDYRGQGRVQTGIIQYIGAPVGVTGDYNGNGTVDAADYVLWRNGGPLQKIRPMASSPRITTSGGPTLAKRPLAPAPAWAMRRLCRNRPAGCWLCLFPACCARYAGDERPLRSSAKIVVTCNRFCGGTQWRTSCPREA